MRDGLERWRNGQYAGVLSGICDAKDIYINSSNWYEHNHIILSAGVRAIGIDRLSKAVYASDGRLVPNDKLVLAAGSLPFMPPIDGLHSDDGALLPEFLRVSHLRRLQPNDEARAELGLVV